MRFIIKCINFFLLSVHVSGNDHVQVFCGQCDFQYGYGIFFFLLILIFFFCFLPRFRVCDGACACLGYCPRPRFFGRRQSQLIHFIKQAFDLTLHICRRKFCMDCGKIAYQRKRVMTDWIKVIEVFIIVRIICFYGINFFLQFHFKLREYQIRSVDLCRNAHVTPGKRGTHAVRKHRPAGRYGSHDHNEQDCKSPNRHKQRCVFCRYLLQFLRNCCGNIRRFFNSFLCIFCCLTCPCSLCILAFDTLLLQSFL